MFQSLRLLAATEANRLLLDRQLAAKQRWPGVAAGLAQSGGYFLKKAPLIEHNWRYI
jgi:hypothetical protein